MLTGRRTSLEDIGPLVYAVRRGVPNITVFDFRGAVPDTGASTVRRLGEQPVAACHAIVAMARHPAVSAAAPPAELSAAPALAAAAVAAR